MCVCVCVCVCVLAGVPIIRLGDKEVEYNYNFRFYITTKLSNPHYSPEIASKTTIVNFAVILQGATSLCHTAASTSDILYSHEVVYMDDPFSALTLLVGSRSIELKTRSCNELTSGRHFWSFGHLYVQFKAGSFYQCK